MIIKKCRSCLSVDLESSLNLGNQALTGVFPKSKKENILLKKMTQYWQHLQKEAQNRLDVFEKELQFLKEHRKQKSSELQQKIFDHYSFLNAHRQTKSLGLIFEIV